jgi:hypothetical protein
MSPKCRGPITIYLGINYKTFNTSRAKTEIIINTKTAPSVGMRCSSSSTDAHRHHYTCNQWLEETALFSGYKSQRTKGHREDWKGKKEQNRGDEEKKKTQETERTRARKQREGGRPRTKNWGGENTKKPGERTKQRKGKKTNTKGRKQRAKPSFGLVPEFKHNIQKKNRGGNQTNNKKTQGKTGAG